MNRFVKCPECEHDMDWTGLLSGWKCPACGTRTGGTKPPDEAPLIPGHAHNAEAVIGPTGAPLWDINGSKRRLGSDRRFVETFQVRAATYDGALLLAREMHLDLDDAEATAA